MCKIWVGSESGSGSQLNRKSDPDSDRLQHDADPQHWKQQFQRNFNAVSSSFEAAWLSQHVLPSLLFGRR
jgi:hypothetical protein